MASFNLTKAHILKTFAPLAETSNLAHRNTFFATVSPSVTWTITGTAHSLAGTRHTLQSHSDASFNRLGPRLRGAIRFVVTRVVLDAEPEADGSRWACVETTGEAVRKTGERYDNEYIWLTRWDREGTIVEIRSYFDTLLSEQVLLDPEPEH